MWIAEGSVFRNTGLQKFLREGARGTQNPLTTPYLVDCTSKWLHWVPSALLYK